MSLVSERNMAGVTIVGWADSDGTDVAMLSGGDVGLLRDVISSSVGDPSNTRCFFDFGVDALERHHQQCALDEMEERTCSSPPR